MKLSMSKKRLRLVVAAGLAAALGAGTGAWAVASNSPAATPAPSSAAKPEYETNSAGQSFGSAARADAPDAEPDLILVVADNGEEGYVKKAHLDPPAFTSPQAALEWQTRVGSKSRILPVFKSDGTTKIGTFTIEPAAGETVQAP